MRHVWKVIVVIIIISSFFIYFGNKSRFDSRVIKYNGNKLLISVDGIASDKIPTEGNYYLTSYKCGSVVTKVYWDSNNHVLSISNGNKEGGVACNLTFESRPYLSSMKPGSYVKYVGTNGCVGRSCEGFNTNYVDDNDMGYCFSKDNKFLVNGWRLFYSDLGTAYLVSAGSLECINRDSNVNNSILYVNLLNSRALGYCNREYAYNGECNNYSARSINEEDFDKYLDMNIFDCTGNSSNRFCGYNDDLIDNGGYYWYSSIYDSASDKLFNWNPVNRVVNKASYVNDYGLRVVVRLKESVYVVSGDGTYNNPYVISYK